VLPIDYVANARSLGVHALRATTREELYEALRTARRESHTTMIVVETDRDLRVGSYHAWWDVPVAEVSEMDSVRAARAEYEQARRNERYFL
jgi:3D-(3,5/4)-trihydroxycyclohexane-1,2-dione acylhydrolase (decyclizing)